MKNKTRRIILNGIWTAPILSAVSLPAHAQCSPGDPQCDSRPPEIEVQNVVCVEGSLGSVTFDLCNTESEAVTATGIDSASLTFVEHTSPPLPLVINPGECISCSAHGVNAGFDCSGNFGFGYIFTSESGYLEGIGGIVSLFTP